MTDSDDETKHLKTCYSVGSYGPFPITFYSRDGQVYCHPQEHGEQGPFDSLEEAMKYADMDFGDTDGGFHESDEEAEKHADWMRKEGYGVE
jgi:hypothetical protein